MLPGWIWDPLPAKFRRYENLRGFDRWRLYGREDDEECDDLEGGFEGLDEGGDVEEDREDGVEKRHPDRLQMYIDWLIFESNY
jgi:hypothetical protein